MEPLHEDFPVLTHLRPFQTNRLSDVIVFSRGTLVNKEGGWVTDVANSNTKLLHIAYY